jgi:DinB superfamily
MSEHIWPSVLKSQYHASLAMLRDAIERCPDPLWVDTAHKNAFWQIAYHTLFYTHLYLHPDEASFQPWAEHQGDVQYPSGLRGRPDVDSRLPAFPDPYSKAQVLRFWILCDGMVDAAVDGFDFNRGECGFWWYKMSKLEHQLVNIRHIQHHTAQLMDRLRASANLGIRWVGSRHPDA